MFTYDIQYGGDPHSKSDMQGTVKYDDFISAFENFPWLDEIEKANANPDGCSPTLSVKNVTAENDLWVSMSGDRDQNGYLVGFVYPKSKKGLLGLGKEKTVRWLEIYLTDSKQQVVELFRLYFDEKYDELHNEIRQFLKYMEMKAKN